MCPTLDSLDFNKSAFEVFFPFKILTLTPKKRNTDRSKDKKTLVALQQNFNMPSGIAVKMIFASQGKNLKTKNGKKTKGRVKIKMEYIDDKLRRYTTFSKRKTETQKWFRILDSFGNLSTFVVEKC